MIAVCDIETDGLKPTVIWYVVCKNHETKELRTFERPDLDPGPLIEYANGVTMWVFHNGLGYDVKHLNRLVPGLYIDPRKVCDTLVISRLTKYDRKGGHSLDAYGRFFGHPKSTFDDFSQLSPQLLERCVGDVHLTDKVFTFYKPWVYSRQWQPSIRLEHDTVLVCNDLHDNGFAFDIDGARKLHDEIVKKLNKLNEELQVAFPPKSYLIREITPQLTKSGTLHAKDFKWLDNKDLSPFEAGATFSRIGYQEFNPGSPKQVVERLWEAGWKPFSKTKGHIQAERIRNKKKRKEALKKFEYYGWKVDEDNLGTLPDDAPEAARKLVEWLMLNSRRSVLEEWFNAFSEQSGRIHGNFNFIGAWTHRKSHSEPNMANPPRVTSPYGMEMRSKWVATRGKVLIGTDADQIQLRLFGHYVNDKRLIEALESGDKSLGTDVHSLNKKLLGDVCADRDTSKTFIYAYLLGAAYPKIASIFGCSHEEAKEAVQKFMQELPLLKEFKETQVPLDAERGFFVGLDGRKVAVPNAHKVLAGYLQNGESVVMKRANLLWRSRLEEEGIWFRQVNDVHDEWQTETDDDRETIKLVQRIQCESIEQVGRDLNLNVKLAGESKHGYNWAETH